MVQNVHKMILLIEGVDLVMNDFLRNKTVQYVIAIVAYIIGWALYDLVKKLFRKVKKYFKKSVKSAIM